MPDFTKLTYEDYVRNIEYWNGTLNLVPPSWAEEISARGGVGVSALDFYGDIFGNELEPSRMPEDYRTGEYGAILLELRDEPISKEEYDRLRDEMVETKKTNIRLSRHKDENGKWHYVKVHPRRTTITDDMEKLADKINKSKNFCLLAPVSYAGRSRHNDNARYMYALAVEIDGIQPKTGISELFYSWERTTRRMPKPTYIVCSGSGIHLYYLFDRPIPMFANIMNQLTAAKEWLTRYFWDKPVTTLWEKVQYESICQGFRVVGTRGKDARKVAMAFKVGDRITIEQMNECLPHDRQINRIYKSDLPLSKAKQLYPDWYNRIVVKKEGKGVYNRHEGIYHNWIKKITDEKNGAVLGKRYYCLENLCSLAVQCNIPPEQVESDCREVARYLETLTNSDDNHFTEYDIACALYTYHNGYSVNVSDEKNKNARQAYTRKLEYIENHTGIRLVRAKRNGRKQIDHIKRMTILRDSDYPDGSWRGATSKEEMVKAYIEGHPDEKPAHMAKELGVSRTTIYKYLKNAPAEEPKVLTAEESTAALNMLVEMQNSLTATMNAAMASGDFEQANKIGEQIRQNTNKMLEVMSQQQEQMKRLKAYRDKLNKKH